MKHWVALLFLLLGMLALQARGYALQRGEYLGDDTRNSPDGAAKEGLGTTRLFLNPTSGVVNAFVYNAWGTLIGSNGQSQTVYLYTSEQFDFDLGFYYLRARYLSTGTGRFWTRDSWEGNQEDPLSLHKYLYCHADPVNGVDPSGHASAGEMLTVGAVMTFLASSFVFNIAAETPTATIDLAGGKEFEEVVAEVGKAVAIGVAIDVATLGGAKLFKAAKFLAHLKKVYSHGKAGEEFLEKMWKHGKKHVYFRTTKGARIVDRLVDGVAMESKQGRVCLEKKIQRQIEKDVELLKDPASGVKEVQWYFFPGKSGFGPTPALEAELNRHGIKVIRHEDFL